MLNGGILMLTVKKDDLSCMFEVDHSNKSIKNIDDIFGVINTPAYKDMQPRHFPGIGKKKDERKKIFLKLADKFKSYFETEDFTSTESFDKWHKKQCDFLKKEFRKLSNDFGNKMTRGKAQKLINMTFKHLFLFGDAENKYFENHAAAPFDTDSSRND